MQDELKQKDPKLKSILVRRKAESKKTLIEKEERKSVAIKEPVPVDISKRVKEEVSQQKLNSVETIPPVEQIVVAGEVQRLAEIKLVPDDTQPEREEVSHRKPDFVITTPPVKEDVVTSDEQMLAETGLVPDHAKPEQEETSRLESDSVATTLPAKEIVVTGDERPLDEMELAPGDTPSEQKEIFQQKPVTVKTVADVVPEEDDPFIAVSVPPQSTIEKVEDVVIPDEMITSEKVVYSINANSYPVEKIAVDEVIRLKLLGFDDVYIRTDDLGEGEIWYRVMIGKFSTREDAQTVQDELIQKDAELKSIIIKLENESIE
jgi:cell division protein FtsN